MSPTNLVQAAINFYLQAINELQFNYLYSYHQKPLSPDATQTP